MSRKPAADQATHDSGIRNPEHGTGSDRHRMGVLRRAPPKADHDPQARDRDDADQKRRRLNRKAAGTFR
jgi:hypothetical protein